MRLTLKILLLVLTANICVYGQIKSFDLYPGKKDTINILDSKGLKQGHWIVFGSSKPRTCYKLNAKVEEGDYKDNKKTGVWSEHYCSGNPKNEITFVNGRPDGPATMYHENGKLAEEGVWKINRWVGKCITGDPDGTVHEYFYDEKGARYEISKTPVAVPKPTKNKK